MSLSFRRPLRAVLTPTAVTLLRCGGRLRAEPAALESFPVATDDAPAEGSRPWKAALASLRGALAHSGRRGESLEVVLSNHYCHYLVLPPLPSLASSEEDQAYARHGFREVYGDTANGWSVRVSGDSPARMRLAAALEDELLEGVRRTVREAGLWLESVQPLLMTAYNAYARQLAHHEGWFALYEPGRVCLCRCSASALRSVRSCASGEDWRAELPLLLDREARLQGLEGEPAPGQVLVFHPAAALSGRVPIAGGELAPLPLREADLWAGASTPGAAMALLGI